MDSRYSDHWEQSTKLTRAMTANRCCLCLKGKKLNSNKSMTAHHMSYGFSLFGFHIKTTKFEFPLVQLIPVCLSCHRTVHGQKVFFHARKDIWKRRNRFLYTQYLRLRLLLAMFMIWVVPVLVLVFLVLKFIGG